MVAVRETRERKEYKIEKKKGEEVACGGGGHPRRACFKRRSVSARAAEASRRLVKHISKEGGPGVSVGAEKKKKI